MRYLGSVKLTLAKVLRLIVRTFDMISFKHRYLSDDYLVIERQRSWSSRDTARY